MARLARKNRDRHRRRQGHRPALFAGARRRRRARDDRRHRRRQGARRRDRRPPRRQFSGSVKFDVSDEKAVQERWWRRPSSASARSTSWSTTRRSIPRSSRAISTNGTRTCGTRVMAINMRGPLLMVKHVAPHMIERRVRQDHQHRLGRRLQGRAAHAALRHSQGRHAGLHPLAVARARRNTASRSIRCRPAISSPTPGLENATHVEEERMPGAQFAAPSSATRFRKTCSAR